jgi:hypothetical protein
MELILEAELSGSMQGWLTRTHIIETVELPAFPAMLCLGHSELISESSSFASRCCSTTVVCTVCSVG